MLRINNDPAGTEGWVTGNLLAGSVLNLAPSTTYDIRVTLSDPDGVTGTSEHLFTAATRALPADGDGAVWDVYPSCAGIDKPDPCFEDVVTAAMIAQPGDLILIHDGVYAESGPLDLTFLTEHPTAAWTGQQLREAFPWDTAPRYIIRDRDGIYGNDFIRCVRALGIKQVLTAPRSPWQNPYVERVIGSIRRECTDHVIVFNENHLRRVLQRYVHYYHRSRTHLSLAKDAPEPRRVEPPGNGQVVESPEVGGLQHRYARRAA